MPSNPLPTAAVPPAALPLHAPRERDDHRQTRSPRLRPDRGSLWLGAGLCLATLLLLRGSDLGCRERP